MCWSIFCVFHKFQGDSRFLHKIPGYIQASRSQHKFQAFQGFQGAVGTLTKGWSVLARKKRLPKRDYCCATGTVTIRCYALHSESIMPLSHQIKPIVVLPCLWRPICVQQSVTLGTNPMPLNSKNKSGLVSP